MAINKNRLYLVLVLLAVAGYWYFSPYLTVYQLRTAAQAGDASAFNKHVDYPQLRDSVKRQLAAMAAEPSATSQDSFANKIGLLVIDKLVNAFVRPEAVMLAMQKGVFQPQQKHAGLADEPARKPEWSASREGVNTFIISTKQHSALALVLGRSGFADWKLTEVRLPAEVRQP